MLGFGAYGAANLAVEDTQRNFIPKDSYLTYYIDAVDEFYPSSGIELMIVFQDSAQIYEKRDNLANLETRLTGLSTAPPYIAEPTSEATYRNLMSGYKSYLDDNGIASLGINTSLGEDGGPTSESDFVMSLQMYTSFMGPGAIYAQDVTFSEDGSNIEAMRVKSEYVSLMKTSRGKTIDDSDKQIQAMDETREMIESWGEDVPPAFTYSDKFISIEGFKRIRSELLSNVGWAFFSVAIIVFLTVASPGTSILVTVNVAFCIIEILGFMFYLGIAIDSVSTINIVLAVGLSIDYSAHVGHCFMHKGGTDKNARATEALADIGAAVLNGAATTFLAVVVLLFSSSYVFQILSQQFALTVVLGVAHGLILLPVLLSLMGPKAFASADMHVNVKAESESEPEIESTPAHTNPDSRSSEDEENQES